VHGSNCRTLFEKGWSGLFIEANKRRYKQLYKNYKAFDRIHCCRAIVGTRAGKLFDDIVGPYLDSSNIDFCSIDIDGEDLEVFETFERYLPTVVCIEGGQMLHPYHKRVSLSIARQNIQQSLNIMVRSFEAKGYHILCSYQDSFFIKSEYYDKFNVSSDLMKLYFDGLAAIYRRLPFIRNRLERVGLRNEIVDDILANSDYSKYGYEKRKLWAKEQKERILEVIKDRYKQEIEDTPRA
jgi:hypothetical protein